MKVYVEVIIVPNDLTTDVARDSSTMNTVNCVALTRVISAIIDFDQRDKGRRLTPFLRFIIADEAA